MSKASPTVSERTGYIGGSDAAVLLGFSEWSTPIQLWAQKTNRAVAMPPDPERDALFYFGHLLEGPIGQAVQDRHGVKVKRARNFYRSATYPWMGGHIDFLFQDGAGFLECKNVRYDSAWGAMQPDPLNDEASHLIPSYYLAQCLHYMVVLSVLSHCYIAALIGGSDLRIYRVDRSKNQPLIDELIAAEDRFWHEYVLPDKMPPSQTAEDVLFRRSLLPADPGEDMRVVTLSEEQAVMLRKLHRERTTATRAKNSSDKLRDLLVVATDGPARLEDARGGYLGSISLSSRYALNEARFLAEAPTAHALYKHFHDEGYFFRISVGKDLKEDA